MSRLEMSPSLCFVGVTGNSNRGVSIRKLRVSALGSAAGLVISRRFIYAADCVLFVFILNRAMVAQILRFENPWNYLLAVEIVEDARG